MASFRRMLALAALALPLAATARAQTPGTCRDPWVTELVTQIAHRPPNGAGELGECNIRLYGAQWSSKDDLRNKIAQTFAALKREGLEFRGNVGRALYDSKMNYTLGMTELMYVGPRANAPRKRFYLDLPNGYTMAWDRNRCIGEAMGQGCPTGSHQ